MASTSLLIDYDNIVEKNKLINLKNKVSPIPEGKNLGLVLIIPKIRLIELENIPLGNPRVMFINSDFFIKSIEGYAFIMYDKKRKICEIINLQGQLLPQILNSVLSGIPNDVTIYIGISLDINNFKDLVTKYVLSGFKDPFITKKSPLGFKYENYAICLTKINNITEDNNEVLNDVEYVLKEYYTSNQVCKVSLKLSKKSIKYLKNLSNIGSTLNNDGSVTQKEIAGKFDVIQTDSDLEHILEVNKKSIISGNEEGVEVANGFYNFHSHPRDAYLKYNVEYGWPSSQDYVGFVSASKNSGTILHSVITMEGIYFISFSEEGLSKKKDIDYDFIYKNYDIKHQVGKNPSWYVDVINSILYKDKSLLNVEFLNWDNIYKTINVYYSKEGVNCFAREETKKKYNLLIR